MLHRQCKLPTERIGVRLSASERKFLLDSLGLSKDSGAEAVRQTPAGQPIRLTPDELDQLVDELAVQLSRTEDRAAMVRLERLCAKAEVLLDFYTD
jgi:hypothetical protein